MSWQEIPLAHNGLARIAFPAEAAVEPPVFVLLHGWTGDQRVMEPFTRWLPRGLFVLLRAPFALPEGGYGWLPALPQGRRSTVADYQAGLRALHAWLHDLQTRFPQARWDRMHWVGFSQGACVAALYALHHPQRLATLASIVGFLPQGAERLIQPGMWQGRHVFATWGTRDPIIPLSRAREMETLLRRTGAHLTVCYAETGHKLGAPCRDAFRAFYRAVA